MVQISDVEKLTIPELKAQLSKRELDTNGSRAELVSRMLEHLKSKEESKNLETATHAIPDVTNMTLQERMEARAKRFNIKPFNSFKTNKHTEDPERLKKRVERFGIQVLSEKERNERRIERFGKVGLIVDKKELEMREKRKERFGMK